MLVQASRLLGAAFVFFVLLRAARLALFVCPLLGARPSPPLSYYVASAWATHLLDTVAGAKRPRLQAPRGFGDLQIVPGHPERRIRARLVRSTDGSVPQQLRRRWRRRQSVQRATARRPCAAHLALGRPLLVPHTAYGLHYCDWWRARGQRGPAAPTMEGAKVRRCWNRWRSPPPSPPRRCRRPSSCSSGQRS